MYVFICITIIKWQNVYISRGISGVLHHFSSQYHIWAMRDVIAHVIGHVTYVTSHVTSHVTSQTSQKH